MKQFVKLGVRVSVSFTIFVLFMSIIGTLFGEDAKEISTMFALGGDGISFQVIVQGFFLITLISLVNVIIEEPTVLRHMLYLWKFIIKLVLSAIFTIVFVIVFQWFPVHSLAGWIGFIISFGLCVSGSTLFMIYKTKKEDQEVQKLFQSYKQHQKGERK